MFVDNENQFTSGGTSGQSVVSGTNFVAATTTALANVIDSGPLGGQNTPNTNVGRDFGMGYPSWIYWLNVASATSGGSATLTATLVSSAAATLTSPNTMLTLYPAGTGYATLAALSAVRYLLPRAGIGGTTGWLRYLGVNVTVATANLTGGTFNVFLTRDIQDNLIYAAGYTVS